MGSCEDVSRGIEESKLVQPAATAAHTLCCLQIVQFIGAHIDVEQIVLVTEFLARGDLYRALSADFDRNFCWAKRWANALVKA